MKKAEVKKIPLGLYKVYWKSGGHSLAAIGMIENGDKWLAPINWVRPTEDQDIWRRVEKLKLIKKLYDKA